MTATSVVPPPISTIMLPEGSVIGSPAPIAAAIGSSIRYTTRAPAASAASRSALFDPTARGGADHETRVDEITAVVGLLNELAQHAFGDPEVSDDAVLERTDRDDRAGRTAEHLLGFGADGENAAAAITRV